MAAPHYSVSPMAPSQGRQRAFVADVHQGAERIEPPPSLHLQPPTAWPLSKPHPRLCPARARVTAFAAPAAAVSAARAEKGERNLSDLLDRSQTTAPHSNPNAHLRREPFARPRETGPPRVAPANPEPARAAPPTAHTHTPSGPAPASDWLEPAVGGTGKAGQTASGGGILKPGFLWGPTCLR